MSSFDSSSMEGATGIYPWFWGSYWLGPPQLPPLPMFFGMTDRVTGAIYYGTLNAAATHIVFSTTKPGGNAPVVVYGPFDGPFVGQAQLRMGIRNAHLVLDQFNNEGAGPFFITPGNQNQIAGVFATTLKGNYGYDHLMFQIGSARFSVFAAPHTTFFDQFLPGGGVLIP